MTGVTQKEPIATLTKVSLQLINYRFILRTLWSPTVSNVILRWIQLCLPTVVTSNYFGLWVLLPEPVKDSAKLIRWGWCCLQVDILRLVSNEVEEKKILPSVSFHTFSLFPTHIKLKISAIVEYFLALKKINLNHFLCSNHQTYY